MCIAIKLNDRLTKSLRDQVLKKLFLQNGLRFRQVAKATIGTISVEFRCSTREVDFLFGHKMVHRKKEHDGDKNRCIRMIIDKHDVDLLSIGVGCPPKKHETSDSRKQR